MANLIKWDPFADINSLHRDLDNMFNSFFNQSWPIAKTGLPAMDIYTENDKQLVAEVHVPGFTKDEVEISVHEGALEIRGEKQEKEEKRDKKRSYMVRQSNSSFYRRVALPKQANEDKVKAEFKDGLLKVTVPFKELPAPKKVAITEGNK
jgi:HSP20 family protein